MVGSDFAEALSGEEEVQVSVVRRRGGKKRTIPV
jgi:hypothetical protein